ncbi:MAG: peptidylprolyl isomerase, partial [Candidatus Peregrinibacteria bacterium]|nr:peptidylprolyl isomerase [Candidatus Peregrinibacteria bacterium]
MNKRMATNLSLIALITIVLGFFDLPYTTQNDIVPVTPDSFEEQGIHLGLDLQGGTQLDYKIDLRKVDEADQEDIIEGVLEVITKRVNGLGVAEPNIYRSQVADEEHIIVELAGISDIEEAKAIVGKTIQLEFKTQNNRGLTGDRYEEIQTMAQSALDKISTGSDFALVGEEEALANPTLTYYFDDSETYKFAEDYPTEYFPYLDEMEIGNVIPELIETSDGYTANNYGSLIDLTGFYIVKLTGRQDGEKEYHEDKEVEASHVLIAFEGSQADTDEITRTQEEALALAEEIRQKALDGEDFGDLAKEYSDEAAAVTTGGDLDWFGPGDMVEEFENAAYATEIGGISEVVETQFGYHIIWVMDVKEAVNETVTATEYALQKIYFSTIGDEWEDTELTGEHFVRADVAFTQTYADPYVSIEFNKEGATLFEELTSANVGKQIAIFVGGDLISAPNVNETISGG